jgi:Flp pilus assembly protein TadG
VKWRRRSRGGESGSATAELALALPTLIVILALAMWMQAAVALQARCQDAARAGARAAARGDADGAIRAAVVAALPSGAEVGISRAGGMVTVSVRAVAHVPTGLSSLVGAPSVSGSATAVDEDP